MLRREDGYALSRASELDVRGQGKKGKPKIHGWRQIEEESMMVGVSG